MQTTFKPHPKDFNLMVLGQVISILGSALLRFALSLYVLDITGREDIFTTLFAIRSFSAAIYLPVFAVSLVMLVIALISQRILRNEGEIA